MDTTNQSYYRAILAAYPLPPALRIEERDSGMNNTTRYAVLEDGQVQVLRVYENHRSDLKLAAEHELLLLLARQALPFQIPCPLHTKQGGTWTTAPDGKLAAVFAYLPGAKPAAGRHDLSYAYGRAVGELTLAMEELQPAAAPAYPPYDELLGPDTEEAAASARRLYNTDPALSALAGDAGFLLDVLNSLSAQAASIRRLERQWIHGDFSHSNVLVEGGEIRAVLDFEFATRDLRAMELAVCLAEQLSAPGGLSRAVAKEMLAGYRSVRTLVAEELERLPELLQLRKLDVFLHFLHRYQAGLDPAQVLQDQTRKSSAVCRFIGSHADWIRSL
ncbi:MULTISPECIES: phosphotransferase [Paenibacillus]|uniref:Phosphotransferase n=1 Tax=Paenibacillus macerans TaxID=44252 RepID=A0A090ZCA1_PAEMA|nr:phosphotransferase [Paenibacillus macerans]KFN08262.1 phosphotransferase enzyme family protein [Paenibacillus macerans]MCY7559498.1 phosphotransferase [Paenibacillus macerans]MEC0152493.1 phosphotransferase [Paenibacillus macerans]MUG24577.1 phosphotransferase [Paenibacillus macerans]UMV45743.1 phosphotransferase [Paenibacillus macerans]